MEPNQEVCETLRDYIIALEVAVSGRKTTLILLHGVKTAIEESYNKSRIAKIASGAAGVTGSVMNIVGLALIPVTFGGSIALAAIGGALGAAGGITAAGADAGHYIVSKERMKYGEELCATDFKNMQKLKKLGKKYQKLISTVSQRHTIQENKSTFGKLRDVVSFPKIVYYSFKLVDGGSDTYRTVKMIKAGTDTARIAITPLKIVGGVIDIICIPMDLYTMIRASIDVYNYHYQDPKKRESSSDRAKTVQETITKLEKELKLMEKELQALKTSPIQIMYDEE